MTKSNITEYDNTAANNTDVEDVPLGENLMYPSHVNNAFREMMADLADINDGTVSLTSPSFAAASLTGNLSFGDNNKAIFGAGTDLQIYHDGSNSAIQNATGELFVYGGGDQIRIRAENGEESIVANPNGSVDLYHNGSAKLATTSTGISVAEALQIDTNGTGFAINSSSNAYMVIDRSAANRRGELVFSTASTNVLNSPPLSATTDWALGVSDSDELAGDAFYISTQSGVSAAKMVITRAGNVGIGTSSPSAKLDLILPTPAATASTGGLEITEGTKTFAISTTGSSYNYAGVGANELWYYSNSNFGALTFGSDGAVPVKFISNGSERLRITSAGLVGIGTSSPSAALEVNTGAASDPIIQVTNSNAAAYRPSIRIDNQHTGGRSYRMFSTADGDGIFGGGKFSIYDDDASSSRFTIDSSGNVGIGTDSPDAGLHIDNPDNGAITAILDTDNSAVKMVFRNNTETGNNVQIGADGSSLVALTGASERMRIDSAGLVGIGTTSPATYGVDNADDLVIGQGDGHHGITISSYGTSNGTLAFSDQTGATVGRGFVNYDHNVNAMSFGTLSTERMRIDSSGVTTFKYNTKVYTGGYPEIRLGISDSNYFNLVFDNPSDLLSIGKNGSTKMSLTASGNLLVGTTSTDPNSTAGAQLASNGRILATVDGGNAAYFNRLTSDGELVRFEKDGTTVGSIGTASGYSYWAAPANFSLMLVTNDIRPRSVTGSGNNDNSVDIGTSAARFKNLHLGGTAYAGGLDINMSTNARGYFADNIGEVGSGNFALQAVNAAGSALKPLGFRAEDIRFATGSSERMRIDSSGRVFMGKTTSNFAITGVELHGDGTGIFTKSSSTPLTINRTTNDGGLVAFYKDGTTVGSIGSISSGGSQLRIGDTSTGLCFRDDQVAIVPANSTSLVNNTTDLGNSLYRFKDLHLSGTAYAGNVVSQVAINAQTGTAYTTVLADQSKLVTLTNVSPITFTIPANSSVAYPIGTQIDLSQFGAGQVTVAGASGVTVNSASGLKLRAQYSSASCIKVATDTWLLVGNLKVS